ncbi:MAG: hypothetical protein FJX22_01735 [Alphaproteobacteria bacterium]|nr:hypothetical protein [Alphaproteobacteria bacterium]
MPTGLLHHLFMQFDAIAKRLPEDTEKAGGGLRDGVPTWFILYGLTEPGGERLQQKHFKKAGITVEQLKTTEAFKNLITMGDQAGFRLELNEQVDMQDSLPVYLLIVSGWV